MNFVSMLQLNIMLLRKTLIKHVKLIYNISNIETFQDTIIYNYFFKEKYILTHLYIGNKSKRCLKIKKPFY